MDTLYIQIPNLVFRGVFKATIITLCFIPTNDLEINKLNFVVGQFSLITLLSDYDTNKHSNIVEHINWVLSELSVGVHKTVNRIGRTWISLFSRTHLFSCILQVWVTTRFDVIFKLLHLKKTINYKVRYIYIASYDS